VVVHPGRVREWVVVGWLDGPPFDVDFAGAFPVLANGGVVNPGVVGGHLRRGVVQEATHDFLGNVVVDQPCAEGVAELVRGDMSGSAVFVADVAVCEPLLQRDRQHAL
jgi:hypothetical protein